MFNTENPLILAIDSNQDALEKLEILLKTNNYRVITAINGDFAITILNKLNFIPDLILCEIEMPNMNGYEFYKIVSSDPRWIQIPFIFLTAKSAEEDIRFGKSLGVDGYMCKPFDEKDLLATITGKLNRKQNKLKFEPRIADTLKNEVVVSKSIEPLELLGESFFVLVYWDDRIGPILKQIYPKIAKTPFNIEQICLHLFDIIKVIYGQNVISSSEGVLLNISKIDMGAYLYFNYYNNNLQRSGQIPYMIGYFAKEITYPNTIKFKKIYDEITKDIKTQKDCDLSRIITKFKEKSRITQL